MYSDIQHTVPCLQGVWTDHKPEKDEYHADCISSIAIYGNPREIVNKDTGSRISSSMSLKVDVNTMIAKAVAIMARLNKTVWDNHLTENIKLRLYQTCVLSTLLYGSETWTK